MKRIVSFSLLWISLAFGFSNCLAQDTNNLALLDNGLVARWKGDGNANDVTGNHNGSLQNGLSFTAGKVGLGFDFTGKKGGYVEIPDDPSLHLTQAITLEAWIKANNWDGTPRIIQKSTDNIDYLFHVQGADPPSVPNLVLYLWGVNVEGSPAPQVILAPAPSLGTWHHVAGTYDGSKITLFIDGKIVAQHNASGSISVSSDVINIGNKPHSTDPGPYFDGVIDEVAIYNRALSAGEIQAIYDSGNAGNLAIVTQPKDQEIPIGGTARFNVSASGQGELSYQWRFNGARIIGATNSDLVLPQITQLDFGSYTVEITDSKASIVSKSVALSIFRDSDGDGLSDNYENGVTRYKWIAGAFTWAEAKADAEARGGHLVTITSQAEWESISINLPNGVPDSFWIGLLRPEGTTSWSWVTGEPFLYSRWSSGSPKGVGSFVDIVQQRPDGLWLDRAENIDRQPYILEFGSYSDPNNPDTDGDGLSDGDEVNKYGTFPNFADSNQNGVNDKDELTPRFRSIKLSTFSGCRLTFGGLVGINYSVEVSSNLIDWVGLMSLNLTNGTMTLVDPSTTNQLQKFYRAKQIP